MLNIETSSINFSQRSTLAKKDCAQSPRSDRRREVPRPTESTGVNLALMFP